MAANIGRTEVNAADGSALHLLGSLQQFADLQKHRQTAEDSQSNGQAGRGRRRQR